MHARQATTAMGRALLTSCVVWGATGLSAAPAWAAGHRHRVPPVVAPVTTTTADTATTLPAPTPPAPAPADTCVRGVWPAEVSGRPTSFQAGTDGIYLWYDPDGGWALRVTNGGQGARVIFSGSLTTTGLGTFQNVHGNGGSGNFIVAPTPNHRTVLFRFVNYGTVDGIDFSTRCARAIRVEVHISGRWAPVSEMHLGGTGLSPLSNPFRVQRVAKGSAAALGSTEVSGGTNLSVVLPVPA